MAYVLSWVSPVGWRPVRKWAVRESKAQQQIKPEAALK